MVKARIPHRHKPTVFFEIEGTVEEIVRAFELHHPDGNTPDAANREAFSLSMPTVPLSGNDGRTLDVPPVMQLVSYLRSLGNGLRHSMADVQAHLFKRRLSYAVHEERSAIKLLASHLAKARMVIEQDDGGTWRAELTAPKQKGGTKLWQFIKE